jgi:hypothetical protein
LALVLPGPQRLRPGDPGSTGAFNLAYLIFNSGAILFSLASLYALLNLWFSARESLAGVLLATATMPLTFQDQYFHPWSFVEFGLFALGFWLIERERYAGFAVVLALASLNRETSLSTAGFFLHPRAAWAERKRRQARILAAVRGLRRALAGDLLWVAHAAWFSAADLHGAGSVACQHPELAASGRTDPLVLWGVLGLRRYGFSARAGLYSPRVADDSVLRRHAVRDRVVVRDPLPDDAVSHHDPAGNVVLIPVAARCGQDRRVLIKLSR